MVTWIAALPGHDWVKENDSDVHEVGEFLFSKISRQPTRWVLAVPEDSRSSQSRISQGKRIATEVVNLTKAYLKKHGVKAEVEFSWGATEVKAHELVDAIVEVTETGSSLRANNLRIVDTLLTSTPAADRQSRVVEGSIGSAARLKRSRCSCEARSKRRPRSA